MCIVEPNNGGRFNSVFALAVGVDNEVRSWNVFCFYQLRRLCNPQRNYAGDSLFYENFLVPSSIALLDFLLSSWTEFFPIVGSKNTSSSFRHDDAVSKVRDRLFFSGGQHVSEVADWPATRFDNEPIHRVATAAMASPFRPSGGRRKTKRLPRPSE